MVALPQSLCSWMRLIMSLLHPVRADMGVNLCCSEPFVTEHLLHTSQVGSAIEKMRCKRMTQLMRRKARIETGEFQTRLQQTLCSTGAEAFSVSSDEKRISRTSLRPEFEILTDR